MSISLHKYFYLDFINILLVILAISVFSCFKYFSESNKGFIKNHIEKGIISELVSSISKHSFGIYFIHYLILRSIHIATNYQY